MLASLARPRGKRAERPLSQELVRTALIPKSPTKGPFFETKPWVRCVDTFARWGPDENQQSNRSDLRTLDRMAL
jgi:hypothetical protein